MSAGNRPFQLRQRIFSILTTSTTCVRRFLAEFLSTINSDPTRTAHSGATARFVLEIQTCRVLVVTELSGIIAFETGIPFSIINRSSKGVSVLDNAGALTASASSYPDICSTYSSTIPTVAKNSSGWAALRQPGNSGPAGLSSDAGRIASAIRTA